MYNLRVILLLALVFVAIESLAAQTKVVYHSFFQCSDNTLAVCANSWSHRSGSGSYGLVQGASYAADTGLTQKDGSSAWEDKLWSCDYQGKSGAFCCEKKILNTQADDSSSLQWFYLIR
ncbi:uncharacterized protein MELLADRAFT_62969 [Melampsora larici-populina 98AG31]|uniref:Secreted protein n=1 Tax=Melampsora larici-populina (strain 98AG31 / pathotype 3-4-7) TaxID=747676 RepID=F4RKT5_MELLP|nr:uncharacterized protein MELLADRAFT_62969 [Melampsora larici-populina 98AG31]EGG06982.1 hypothetical protein MELLADRAFT_62969 [Melampsora larici-populina 98AG31]